MSCFSTGASTATTIIRENEVGVTPAIADGDTQLIPVVNNTLNTTREIIQSNAVYGDRQRRFSRHGNETIAGNMDVELAHETFDMLFEGVMSDDFAGNVLKIGQDFRTYTVQVGDDTFSTYQVYRGVTVDSMNLSMNTGSLATVSFGLNGVGSDTSNVSIDDAPTDAPDKDVIYHADGNIKINGQLSAYITSINLNVTNNLQSNYAIGSNEPVCQTSTMIDVSGTATFFMKNNVELDRFLNEDTSSITILCDDGKGNTIEFFVPVAKWNSGNAPQQGVDTRTVTLDFEGLHSNAIDSTLRITRS